MKTITYTGPSKIIKKIVDILNVKAPMPLDENDEVTWGTSGQVLSTDGSGKTTWVNQSGGGVAQIQSDWNQSDNTQVDYIKNKPTIPTRVSDLSNDTGFITNTVNNLTNYYLSSNTYTKTEVDSLISAIVTLNILVVQTLPVSDISTTTIYLVPKSTPDTQDVYDEYINLDGTSSGWEHIGSTQIDLSNYYTKTEVNTLLSAKANTADLATVATSGSYTDLINTPTIPAAQIQSDWSQSDSSAVDFIKNKPTGSGHTIWNAIKTALTQRTKLWFADAKVTDDSTEQATKVEVVQLIDDEDELTNAPDGVYQGDYDDAPEDILDASMVAYKNGSVEDALDDLNTLGSNLLTQNLTVNHQVDAVLPIAEPLELNHLYVMSYNGTQGYNDSILFMFTGNNVSINCMASIYSNSPMRIMLTRNNKYIYWSLLSGTTEATITITRIKKVL